MSQHTKEVSRGTMMRLGTHERKLHELLKYKIQIQEKEQELDKKVKALGRDLVKIKFAEKRNAIWKKKYNVGMMRNQLMEMI